MWHGGFSCLSLWLLLDDWWTYWFNLLCEVCKVVLRWISLNPWREADGLGRMNKRVFMVTLYKKAPNIASTMEWWDMELETTPLSTAGISPPAGLELVARWTMKTSNQMDMVEQRSGTSPYSIAPASCVEKGPNKYDDFSTSMVVTHRWWWGCNQGPARAHNLLEIFHQTTHGLLPSNVSYMSQKGIRGWRHIVVVVVRITEVFAILALLTLRSL